MGLGSNGKSVLFRVEGLTPREVAIVATRLFHQASNGISNNDMIDDNNVGRPVIFVDANNVFNKIGRVNPVGHTAQFLKGFSEEGLILYPICDGKKRPQSKQQTNKNRSQRTKSKHNASIYRQELRNISRQLKGGLDEAERTRLEEHQKNLSRKIKSAETSSTNVVPSDFAEELEAQLVKISAHNIQPGGGLVRCVVAAKFVH
jgi:hypothetical protein